MKLLKSLFIFIGLVSSGHVFAQKITLMAGGYSFNAQTSKKKASLTNIGSFSFEYALPIKSQFEFHFGYTLNLEGGISGDIAYGLDLGAKYFPFQWTNNVKFKSPLVSLSIDEKIRPFVGISFHQRQFQSIHTSYAGFGFTIGSEYRLFKKTNIVLNIRNLSLNGPDKASATIMEVLVGLVYNF